MDPQYKMTMQQVDVKVYIRPNSLYCNQNNYENFTSTLSYILVINQTTAVVFLNQVNDFQLNQSFNPNMLNKEVSI